MKGRLRDTALCNSILRRLCGPTGSENLIWAIGFVGGVLKREGERRFRIKVRWKGFSRFVHTMTSGVEAVSLQLKYLANADPEFLLLPDVWRTPLPHQRATLLRGPPRNVVAAISRVAGEASAQESKSPDFTADFSSSRSSAASWHSRCNRGNHYEQRN